MPTSMVFNPDNNPFYQIFVTPEGDVGLSVVRFHGTRFRFSVPVPKIKNDGTGSFFSVPVLVPVPKIKNNGTGSFFLGPVLEQEPGTEQR